MKKAFLALASVTVVLAAVVSVLYLTNAPPAVAAIAPGDPATSGRPYVVKLHAQWCPICRVTKGVWSRIEETYTGRVNLLVLDFTNEANTEASRTEARRLGLDKLFEEYEGATGTIVVLDGRSKEVTASINGSRDFAEYRAAIDAALKPATP